MLFIDMIHVQWRHSQKNGKIILRGVDNVFLFAYTCLPSNPKTNTHEHSNSLCFYYKTHNCRLHEPECNHDAGVTNTSINAPMLYAISVGIDPKKHPNITVLYQEMYSQNEQIVGTVDVTYNAIMFKRGFFADSIMQAQGYGILMLCHTTQDDHNPDPLHLRQSAIHFVNWRQSRILLQTQVRKMTQVLPTVRTEHVRNIVSTQHRDNVDEAELVRANNSNSQWDNSLYSSLKHSVCSTFNLLR